MTFKHFQRFLALTLVVFLALTGTVSAQEGDDVPELTQELSYFDIPVDFMLPEGWIVVDDSVEFGTVIFADSQEMADALNADTPPSAGIFGMISIMENNEVADASELLSNTLGSLGYADVPETSTFDLTDQNPAARFDGELVNDQLSADLNLTIVQSGKGYVAFYLFSFDGAQTPLFDAVLGSLKVAPVLTQDLEFGEGLVKMSFPAGWATQDILIQDGILFADSQEMMDTLLTDNEASTFEAGIIGYVELYAVEPTQALDEFLLARLADSFDLTEVEVATTTVDDVEMATFAGEVDNDSLQGYVHTRVIKSDVGYVYLVMVSFEGPQDALFAAVADALEVDFTMMAETE